MEVTTAREQFTGLILLSGIDAPGITQALFTALSPFAVSILDIEQVVISNRLILTVLIGVNPVHQKAIEIDLKACETALGVDIATLFTRSTEASIASKKGVLHVTVLSTQLRPLAIAALSGAIAESGANIERIYRTASNPVTAIEIVVSGASQDVIGLALAPIATLHGVDIAVQAGGLIRLAKKLIQLDVDSTLIEQEVIELLAAKAGVNQYVKQITESAMRGEIDFEQSLRARVKLLQGLPESVISQVQSEITLTPGARTLIRTLHRLGHSVAVVSGGFIDVIAPLINSLDIKYFKANKLEIIDGFLTGNIIGPVIDRASKAAALREFAELEKITMAQTIAVGDGANDLDMIAAAGLGIAFNAKPAVRAAADSSITAPYLDSVLYLLGIANEDIDYRDAE